MHFVSCRRADETGIGTKSELSREVSDSGRLRRPDWPQRMCVPTLYDCLVADVGQSDPFQV
jgi:hypothetical protein